MKETKRICDSWGCSGPWLPVPIDKKTLICGLEVEISIVFEPTKFFVHEKVCRSEKKRPREERNGSFREMIVFKNE